MTLLTVVSTFGDKDAGTINTTRLLRFVDPPAGILETAKLLQKQMITHFPGKITSEIFGHPPDEERVSQTRLGRCSNKTRRKALPRGLSPKDELEDLYHHLSNYDDGLVCIRDQNSFVASADEIATLAGTCQELGQTKRTIREDLPSTGEDFSDVVTIQAFRDYFDKLFGDLNEGELNNLFPMLCDLSDRKTQPQT